ncbi:IS1/IS1595 family N-terminal zinc-binding domain-containing protein [Paenimyroides ummariense]
MLVKNGFSKAGKQRYKCKLCNKTIVLNYKYNAYLAYINNKIILYIKEGLGIRSMARILKISPR